MIATKELRNAASWFAEDAFNAQTTNLIDEAPAVSSVTLGWTDTDDVSHTATYSIVAGKLVRSLDGTQHTVARRVVSAGFSLSGQTLTFDLEVDAAEGGTKSASLDNYLRRLQ